MLVKGIDHVTIRVHPAQVGAMQAFYADLLGLELGPRPLTFPGAWLYVGGRAVVHIAGNIGDDAPVCPEHDAAGFDHVAFQSQDLAAAKVRLDAAGVAWHEVWRPHLEILQLVLHDPSGMKVELTFDPNEHPDRRPLGE
jgi:catechol 2,3-dioxygenase-like lactoylglutathione lyase family enzyme